MNFKLNMNQRCALNTKKANHILGNTRQKYYQQMKGDNPTIYSKVVRSHVGHCVQFWYPQHKRDMDLLLRVQTKTTKMIKELVYISCEKSVRMLRLFRQERRRIRGDVRNVYKFLKRWSKEVGARLFSVVSSARTRAMGTN